MEVKMALQYDYRDCFVSDWSKEDYNLADNFAWTMMGLGIQKVTAKNLKEISFRMRFLNKIGYPIFNPTLHEYVLKYLDKFIGYKTNVGEEKRFQFIRRWTKALERDLEEVSHPMLQK